jgi:hypothetical protein
MDNIVCDQGVKVEEFKRTIKRFLAGKSSYFYVAGQDT